MLLEIDGWKHGITFSSSHFIIGHNKCGRLHGHNYGIRLKMEGEMNKNYMLMDFVVVKRALRNIAERLDHRVLLPERSPYAEIREEDGESIEFIGAGKRYVFPKNDVVLLPLEATSAEELAKYVHSLFLQAVPLPDNIKRLEIAVDEEMGQGIWYSPED